MTGGAGFIGSTLSEALIKRGESVTVIDDFNDYYDPALKRANLAGLIGEPGFKLIELDIRDGEGLREAVAGADPDVVCHLAARAGVRPSIEDPVLYEEVNCLGTINLLEAVKDL